jgi:NADH:ubiquinone oxidoreductase subunit
MEMNGQNTTYVRNTYRYLLTTKITSYYYEHYWFLDFRGRERRVPWYRGLKMAYSICTGWQMSMEQ